MKTFVRTFLALLFCILSDILPADSAKPSAALIAVASNFSKPAQALADAFHKQTGTRVEFTFGATGKQYTQITSGAPFDAFLAADAERPKLLEKNGKAISGTRFTYAIGRLVLWSPKPDVVDAEGAILRTGNFKHLAIAKPELAPYGLAAKQTLEASHAWEKNVEKIVYGENITQTFQFAQTGNAEIGFVAWAQVKSLPEAKRGSHWIVPAKLHTPILQEAILLRENKAARDFLSFLQTPEARKMIAELGYDLPAQSAAPKHD